MGRLLVGAEIGFVFVDFIQEKPAWIVVTSQDVEPDISYLFASAVMIGFGGFDEFIDALWKHLNADTNDVHGAPISANEDESHGEVRMNIADVWHMTLFAKCAESKQWYIGKASR